MIAPIELNSPKKPGLVDVVQLDGLQEMASLIDRARAILKEAHCNHMEVLREKNEVLGERLRAQKSFLDELDRITWEQPAAASA